MSIYQVHSSCGKIEVQKDGEPICMRKLFELAEPAFSFGDNSDGSRNLAYTILMDYAGELNAKAHYEDLLYLKVMPQNKPTWSISTEEIDENLIPLAKARLHAQKSLGTLKKI